MKLYIFLALITLLTPRQSFALQDFANPLGKGVTPPSQANNLIDGAITGLYYDQNYEIAPDYKNEWQLWMPSSPGGWTPSVCVAEKRGNLQLVPEFNVYPVGTIAVRFALINDSDESYMYGVHATLVKKIDEQWYIVPTRGGGGIGGIDIAALLSENSSSEIIFDIEAMHGLLDEGEYALIKALGRHGRHYVFGNFSISSYGYEVDVADTDIAFRPILYKIDVCSEGYRWLSFWTTGHFRIGRRLEYGEEFDTTGMVDVRSLSNVET